jgi:hypothetical protein
MKTKARRNLTMAVIALAVVACLLFLTLQTNEQAPELVKEDPPVTRDKNNSSESRREQSQKSERQKEGARDQALVELKQKWAAYFDLKKSGTDKNELHVMKLELARESASRLLASREALDLLAFLDGKEARSEAIFFRLRIESLFKSGETDRFIEPLVAAISGTYATTEGRYRNDMNGWSLLMGRNGSDEAAERFQESITDPWPLGDFLHGWYMTRASTDPLGSYTSMVEFLKNGGKGANQSQSLENVIGAFPEEVDFDYEALEAILPVGVKGPDEKVYENARRALLVKWAKEDPSSAVNFIINHSERMVPGHVTYVVEQAIKDLNNEGIEWVRAFPEGMVYDRAAVAVIQRLSTLHPGVAIEWAMSIGDEKLRQTQLRNIETIQNRNKRREK